MFENIPNLYLFVGVALFVVGFLAVLMSVSKYLENEKDNAVKRKEAVIFDFKYDEVNEALSKKFWFGYLAVAVIGAGVSVMLALIALDFLTEYFEIGDEGRLMAVYVVVSVAVWVTGDRFLFTRLGDSAYFARVENYAIKTFLGDTETPLIEPEVAPVENVPEPEETPKENSDDLKSRIAGMTNEEKIALLDALLK